MDNLPLEPVALVGPAKSVLLLIFEEKILKIGHMHYPRA
jgi:hypothetical protein